MTNQIYDIIYNIQVSSAKFSRKDAKMLIAFLYIFALPFNHRKNDVSKIKQNDNISNDDEKLYSLAIQNL